MTEAAASNVDMTGVGGDREATRIALANRVKEAEKNLASARDAEQVALKPKVTEFSGFLQEQAGYQVGLFMIVGENLGKVNPQRDITLNGLTPKLTAIRRTSIKGIVPHDLKPGPVKVKIGEALFDGTIS